MKKVKQIVSVMLCLLMLVAVVPVMNMGMTASAYTEPANVSTNTVTAKANELLTKLGGDGAYFTVNRSYCNSPRESSHGCSNCLNSNIVATDWFKSLFGSVSVSQFPYQYYPNNGTGYPAGKSCHGFANFAIWYIFSQKTTDEVKTKKIGEYALTQTNFENYVWPGDVIRTSAGHSMLVLSWNSSGYTVIDSNYSGPNCQVHIGLRNYSSSTTFAVSRATNAVDEPERARIDINPNGGTAQDSFYVNYGEKCKLTIDSAWKPGYALDGWNLYRPADEKWFCAGEGWYTSAEMSARGYKKQKYSASLNMTLDGSWYGNCSTSVSVFTFFPVWKEATYKININANGGTATTPSLSMKYNTKCNLSPSYVYRNGYKLTGWNLYRPADGKWFAAGQGWYTESEISAKGYKKQCYIPNLSMTLDSSWFGKCEKAVSTFTFYAVWEADDCTINIDANGGTANTSSISVTYGEKCNLDSAFVQRLGYQLSGWNLYRPADGKWWAVGQGWCTPAEISTNNYEKKVYIPKLSMTLDESWFRVCNVPVSSFVFYAVWTPCSHTWNSGTVIKEATANEEGIIRYTCITCGETKDVSVAALQPTGITADLTHVKKSYYVGEALDTSDLELSATYSDGTTETVTEGFTCTPSELTTPGKQTITVNYAGKTCTYEVNVKVEELAPYWGDMNGDKRIDDSDALLVNQYLKGYVELSDEQKCFADVIFDGRVTASDYTKMLRYAKGYEADPISSTPDIRLTTSKSSYNTGDTLESEKFQIVVSSTEGSAVSYTIADGFVLSGYDANKTGTQTISTTFRGLELSTTITVAKAEHTHTYTSSITKSATCSSTGIRPFTCSCGDSYTETVPVNPSNHVNTKNIAATASTCTVKGYTAGVYCNDCKKYISGHTEQPLEPHTLTTQNAKAATCTAEGYTGDQVCTVCKQTITKGTAIAKKAHTLTTVNQKNAGCTTAGYTGDQYCTTCKQTITKGSAVAALGHTSPDGNGNCTRCGTHIKDVTPSQPSNPQPNPNACKYCGKVHTGPFGWLIKFFHSILAIFKR